MQENKLQKNKEQNSSEQKNSFERYLELRNKIPASVFVLPVSKGHSAEVLQECLKFPSFPREWGENYAGELEEKSGKLIEVKWHYLGALQSRKIADLCRLSKTLHAVSRIKEIQLIGAQEKVPEFFVQINISDESQKNGAQVADLAALLLEIDNLKLGDKFLGLMGMAAPIEDVGAEVVGQQFALLRKTRGQYCPRKKLNMGMSGDYQIAIDEGSDLIRVGTAIFGERR